MIVGPKETTYDSEISPLMSQIIEICKRHKIAMLADFCLDDNEDGEALKCTTALLDESHDPEPEQLEAIRVLYKQPLLVAFTITRNG